MNKGTKVRQEINSHVHQLPAEQVKKVVLDWTSIEDAEVTDLEKLLSSEIEKTEKTQKLSIEEKLAAFHELVESHRGEDLPLLSDEAISRESIYSDRF
ncbi:MAG: hypothetical protein QNJ55_30685 [Xenococcus sp. MO_188.B8]|nr:hypothetical protein [Xenococcus sp. MO_188.B8]